MICKKCGLTFNEYFNPPQKNEHKCDSSYLKKRSDDNEDIIVDRIKTYTRETLPILNYYEDQKILYKIDGKRKINEIYEEIRGIIASLKA